ncbi:nitrate reductase molybdenum cofactor assembly chaperone [Aquabacterium sp. A7-Y]|uniref:nitrate reductase molybdenum cofactor assembly chaperone n=1 Tax=Aquabacterium sp. A7-Y TaxID=1349605 RepID=UPI00223C8E81|nr:nitrate reductase molybdenum cofactor assembly chaperone [Aquabacterium sp. A7-Y]MCW7541622.1 nitrate reductase molybdenum cofactor assembly chaperone [Aquabacterium sp. A7-Y]
MNTSLSTSTPGDALRALARLLCYPDDTLRHHLLDVAEVLSTCSALSPAARRGLSGLSAHLLHTDGLDVEAEYVDLFDRGRRTSLHLFEHVHGDSRDRGPAMIDLRQTYAAAGLYLADGELPDFLPVVLEFVSTQPPETARQFLAEMAHILNAIHSALTERCSPYAAVIAATLELAGEPLQAVALPAEHDVDASWAEPEAFGGCSAAGQQAPGQPQAIHIVRSQRPAPTPPGAAV